MPFIRFFCFLTACFAISTTVQAKNERVISIGGDVTEIIYALNAEQNLIGRDSTSLNPPQVKTLPDIGYMRQLNTEGILALKPTKVIASEVSQPSIVLEQLKSAGIQVELVPLKYSPESVVEKIKRIGDIVGKPQQAAALADKFTQEINAVNKSPLDVNILFILNRAGIHQMAAGKGTVADTAIRLIGAKNAMKDAVRFAPISQEGIISANPDLIVLSHLSLENFKSPDEIWTLPGLAHTNAGKHKRLVVVDDIAFLAFGLTMGQELQKMRTAAEQVVK
ncbi:ABC transporter substrate-binding protein [Glaesserella parasuis]|uniref:heme/hemin ABC transporter substrate-binding protein n=1 Tax=Glaesserella parasuis TaxID=738 RepID=UPI001328A9CD|nr:ABC transporter substrate-binding protein [Glaesserella parasuis]MDG6339206.1 ABC transporter substrate-binding protein [Glaesserella parasuis]MDG6815929.1 ABC transporter substrate-binding protein [Glaesserella parasuis]MWQ45944.1 ABC transporter substrate-binding protein [Glaesserella parasuis]MWQ62442.1 ABC transporter substrate-binding protein [Glaesserella parasuis]